MDFEFITHKIEFNSKVILIVTLNWSSKKLDKSKLQICVEILCSLASNGPMNLTQIGHEVELDNSFLVGHLGFLYDRGLVGEQNLDEDEKDYFVTERGLSVLKVMGPLVREAQKIEVHNLERISSALSGVKSSFGKVEEKSSKMKIFEFINQKKPKWKLSDFIKIEIEKTEE